MWLLRHSSEQKQTLSYLHYALSAMMAAFYHPDSSQTWAYFWISLTVKASQGPLNSDMNLLFLQLITCMTKCCCVSLLIIPTQRSVVSSWNVSMPVRHRPADQNTSESDDTRANQLFLAHSSPKVHKVRKGWDQQNYFYYDLVYSIWWYSISCIMTVMSNVGQF